MHDVQSVGLKLAKVFNFASNRNIEVGANFFNLLNAGHYTEYSRTGPNRLFNPATYLTYTNPQTPRALQLEAVVRF